MIFEEKNIIKEALTTRINGPWLQDSKTIHF